MKKYLLIVLSVICVLGMSGCNNKSLNYIISNEPSITGNIKEVYENSIEQKEIKLAAMKRSKFRILVFDSEKYGAYGAYKIANLKDYDLVASNSGHPDEKIDKQIKIVY